MTTDEFDDGGLRGLRRLPAHQPAQARADRARARCHAAMARQQLHRERSERRVRVIRTVLEPAVVAGLCLLYLSAVILDVFRLRGIL